MDWTPERIADLTRLWNEGLTTSEIGKRLGISKNAVVGKAHRMHLSARPSPIKRSARPALPRPHMPVPRTAVPVSRPTSAKPMTAAPLVRKQPQRVVELSNQGCRWPIGHPGEAGFHFCNERALVGKPYCADHASMAYVKVKPKAGEAA